jgi:autotransporter family porin
LTNSSLPGTLADGFWQEPIDIIPVASASAHVGYLNGTLFVFDMTNGNDGVSVNPAGGGVTLSSNLGNGTYSPVTRVVTALGSGNTDVQIGNLAGATVDVVALDGDNNIAVGNARKLVVSVGEGNNTVATGSSSAAQFIGVSGHGNNQVDVQSDSPAEILVFGNGNNSVSARGARDFIEVLGNGNNQITDTGTNDLIWLGGDGNNDIDNAGDGSFTEILAGTGHNHIRGRWGFVP